MNQTFTDFVKDRLEGMELTAETCDPVWARLRSLACRELKRRGLWNKPPIHLGVQGTHWIESAGSLVRGIPKRHSDALDDLVTDLWGEILESRAEYLAARVSKGATLEALILTMVRQAISERQRSNDPLGSKLFQGLRSAVRRLVDNNEITVTEGDPRIDNSTVLMFESRVPREAPISDRRYTEVAQRWGQELLVPWVTGRGGRTQAFISRLADLLRELEEEGFVSISFKALIDALKRDWRGRLAALYAGKDPYATSGDEEPPDFLAEAGPGAESAVLDRLLERSQVIELSKCVEERLARLRVQKRTRNNLQRLWRFLKSFALEEVDPELAEMKGHEAVEGMLAREVPANRALGRILDLRHDRIPEFKARLGEEVTHCRRLLDASATYSESEHLDDRSESSMDERNDLRNEVRRRTAAAFGRETNPSIPDRPSIEIGSLVLFAEGRDEGIEWLVLASDVDSESGDRLFVPADIVPWVGSQDLKVDGPRGSLVLRFGCHFAVSSEWTPRVQGAISVEAVAPETLDRVAAFRHRLTQSDFLEVVDDDQRETDFENDYRDRCNEIEALGRALVERFAATEAEGAASPEYQEAESEKPTPRYKGSERIAPRRSAPTTPSTPQRKPIWLAIAATLALALTMAWLASSLGTNRRLEQRLAEVEVEIGNIVEQRRELEEERDLLRLEVGRLTEDADPVLRERLAGLENELAELASRHAVEIAQLESSGVAPHLFAPTGTQRTGEAEELVVGEHAPRIILEFSDARTGDVLEILDEDGQEILTDRFEKLHTFEAKYIVSTSHLPPGLYGVRLLRGDFAVSDFELWIVRPHRE